ncbi:unnamed protein product [Colias eurytheme]|nr:unnamed protein product [Colias eurytheme]
MLVPVFDKHSENTGHVLEKEKMYFIGVFCLIASVVGVPLIPEPARVQWNRNYQKLNLKQIANEARLSSISKPNEERALSGAILETMKNESPLENENLLWHTNNKFDSISHGYGEHFVIRKYNDKILHEGDHPDFLIKTVKKPILVEDEIKLIDVHPGVIEYEEAVEPATTYYKHQEQSEGPIAVDEDAGQKMLVEIPQAPELTGKMTLPASYSSLYELRKAGMNLWQNIRQQQVYEREHPVVTETKGFEQKPAVVELVKPVVKIVIPEAPTLTVSDLQNTEREVKERIKEKRLRERDQKITTVHEVAQPVVTGTKDIEQKPTVVEEVVKPVVNMQPEEVIVKEEVIFPQAPTLTRKISSLYPSRSVLQEELKSEVEFKKRYPPGTVPHIPKHFNDYLDFYKKLRPDLLARENSLKDLGFSQRESIVKFEQIDSKDIKQKSLWRNSS